MAKRDGSIRLHKEFGVNPTLIMCTWCGKETGEIALLGSSYDGEAPRQMAVSDDPCKACRDQMKQGITFIEMTYKGSTTRTGRWCVMAEKATMRCLSAGPTLDQVMASRRAYVTPDVSAKLGLFNETVAEG